MKPIVGCLALIVACGGVGIVGDDSGVSETPEMMAVALVQLITVDNTFGGGPPPVTEFLVLDRIDPSAGDVTSSAGEPTRPLTVAERRLIEEALDDYGTVRWSANPGDPAAFQMILGVGEPVVEDHTGLVPVSMICGNLCGTWLTYRLALDHDAANYGQP